MFTEASSSKHYGTSDSGAANGQQEDESSAGQSDAKDDETSRVGAARAAAFILIDLNTRIMVNRCKLSIIIM